MLSIADPCLFPTELTSCGDNPVHPVVVRKLNCGNLTDGAFSAIGLKQ